MTTSSSRSMGAVLLGMAGLLAGCGNGASSSGTATTAAAPAPAASSPYKPVVPFQDIMDSVVDASSDYIWNAVSSTSDAKGLHEYQPHTPAEWHEFRRRAVLLAEAANLIAVPGRRVADRDHTIEEKSPLPVAEIQQRLDTQHEQLVGFAEALREVSVKLVDAADRQDVEAVTSLGGTLDEVCESCHLVFWYPPAAQPASQPAAQPAGTGK